MRIPGSIRIWLLALVVGAGVLGAVVVTAEGKVSLQDVPDGVRSTIEKQAAGGRIVEVEKKVEDGVIVYEAEILKDGVESDILVAANGEFLGSEQEEGEHEEGDEEEEGDKEDGESLSWAQLPQAVQKVLEGRLGGAQPDELESESEDGVVVYEAEYEENGIKRAVKLSENGDVLELEEEVASSNLPAAVLAKLKKKYPGAGIQESEVVVQTFYEVTLEVDGKEHEIKLLANGCLLDDDD